MRAASAASFCPTGTATSSTIFVAAGARLAQALRELVLAQRREDQVAADVDHLGRFERGRVDVGGGERGVRAEGVDVAAVLADDGDDHRLRRADARRVRRTPLVSIPRARRSRSTKSPSTSSPTRPQTAAGTPSLPSTIAVFAAQPPGWTRKSPVATSSPAAGSRCERRDEDVGDEDADAESGAAHASATTVVALDPRIGEDVELVTALGRELRDDRALVAGLEPVQRVGRDRVLLAGLEHDLVPDGEDAVGGDARGRAAAAGSPSV